ncbi:helix-turn-helix transcriptional regulator [Streptomyces chumphonensis]|uniref:Helix-turn-helix transcriptional regulator n=1 Tax=Streptomyces chumphonensis TaxID=1214925 RepID=A0A927EXS1_9ACTN|nr:helix-turn-helix transcriptional regulator [Streptomyces chumphonensis]
MSERKLSPRQLATHVGVTAKTVERWLGNAELVPHARNRADVAEVLGVDEPMLWPKAMQTVVKTGPDREVVSVYPYRSACPTSVWAELIHAAEQDIVFAGYTNYFLWTSQPGFPSTLRTKAGRGCRVRFLLGDPTGDVTRQREEIEDVTLSVSTRIRVSLEALEKLGSPEGIEARFSSTLDAPHHVGLSLFRFDDQMLVTPHLARLVGHDSPMMHLRRHQDDGMFDRFAQSTEELWERGRPV